MNVREYFKKNEMQIRSKVIAGVTAGTAMLMSATGARADLAGDITNLSTVITAATGWITDIMGVFMDPPLVIFVGIAVTGIVINKVRKLIKTK